MPNASQSIMSSQQNSSDQAAGVQNPADSGPTSLRSPHVPAPPGTLGSDEQRPCVPLPERILSFINQPEHYTSSGNTNTRSLYEPDAHGAFPFINQIAGIDAVRRALAQRDADHQEQLNAEMQARQEQQAAESANAAGSASAQQGVPKEEGRVDRARQALADLHEARGGGKKA